AIDASKITGYQAAAADSGVVQFLQGIIPHSFVSACVDGNLLQVLLVAFLFGIALTHAGNAGRPILEMLEKLSHVFFGVVHLFIRLARIGAFGAMAYSVGKCGPETLKSL